MNNPVAKNDFNRASVHRDRRRNDKEDRRKQKHKGKVDEKRISDL